MSATEADRAMCQLRAATRRIVLAGILQVIRARRGWSVIDAASQAGISPMTWRRLEDGLEVRQRTLTAADHVLGQPVGTVRRALDDDGVLATLVAMTGIDTPPADPEEIAPYLDALAERLRTGLLTGSATAALSTLQAGAPPSQGRSSAFALGPLPVGPSRSEPEEPSTLTMAAQLVDRMTSRRPMTEAIEHAVAAILDAMPDLVRDR